MKRLLPKVVLGLLVIAGALLGMPCWAVTHVLLNANFNDKPLGVLVGSGGPSAGEPVFVHPDIVARVKAGLLPTPSLQLHHSTGSRFDSIVFEFPGQAEIGDGDLRIAFTLRASSGLSDFSIVVSESGNSIYPFATLNFTATGNIRATDGAGPSVSLGKYTSSEIINVEYIYHLDARTYDLRINNVLLLDNCPHGITASGIGIGRVAFATNKTATNDLQTWGLDDLFVTQTRTLLLDADFNKTNTLFSNWNLRAGKRSPTSVTSGLSATDRAETFSTKSLHFSLASPIVDNIARFQLLGGSRIRSSELRVGFTVRHGRRLKLVRRNAPCLFATPAFAVMAQGHARSGEPSAKSG